MNKVKCPICNKVMDGAGPQQNPNFPFCSSRCKTIDLGRWLKEGYAIPSESEMDDEMMDDDEVPPKPAAPSAVRNREEA